MAQRLQRSLPLSTSGKFVADLVVAGLADRVGLSGPCKITPLGETVYGKALDLYSTIQESMTHPNVEAVAAQYSPKELISLLRARDPDYLARLRDAVRDEEQIG